jgi:hypothetical protein
MSCWCLFLMDIVRRCSAQSSREHLSLQTSGDQIAAVCR